MKGPPLVNALASGLDSSALPEKGEEFARRLGQRRELTHLLLRALDAVAEEFRPVRDRPDSYEGAVLGMRQQ